MVEEFEKIPGGEKAKEEPTKEEPTKERTNQPAFKSDGQIFIEELQKARESFKAAVGELAELFEKEEPVVFTEEVKDMTAAELKQQSGELIQKLWQSSTVAKNLVGELSIIVSELQALEIENAINIQDLNTNLSKIVSTVNNIKKKWKQVELLRQQAFETYEDLSREYSRLEGQKYELISQRIALEWQYRYPLIGQLVSRLVNRKKIQEKLAALDELRQRQASLRSIMDEFQKGLSLPLIEKESVANHINTVVEDVIEKIHRYYENLLQQAKSLETESKIQLDEVQVESLNDDFINQYVLPEIEAVKKQLIERQQANLDDKVYDEDLDREIREISNPDLVAQAVELLKESFKIRMLIPYRLNLTEEERQQERARQEKLNETLNSIGNRCWELKSVINSYMLIMDKPANDKWQEIANLINHPLLAGVQVEVKKSYLEILKEIDAVSRRYSRYDLVNLASVRLRQLDQEINQREFNQLIDELDVKRLGVFRKNKQMQEIFGTDRIEKAYQAIYHLIVERLLESKEHTNESVELGAKLRYFENYDALPLVILNAFREPGYSGEYPFLNDLPRICEEASKDPNKLEKLSIPGLIDVVDLIRKNPKNFADSIVLLNPETEEYELNPINKQIEAGLVKMSLHFLKKAEPKMEYYLLTLFKHLHIDLDEEVYVILERIFQEKRDPKVKEALVDCIIWRSYHNHDSRAVEILLENYDELEPELHQEIKKEAPNLLTPYVSKDYKGKISPIALVALAKILEIPLEDLEQTISFLRQLNDEPIYHSYQTEMLNDYVKLAKYDGMLNLIKQLVQYGYHFQIDHAPVLPDVLVNQEKILSDIQEIKRSFPNFKYQFYSDFQYDPQIQKGKTIYHTDPFEILVYSTPIENIFTTLAEIKSEQGFFRREFSDCLLRILISQEDLFSRQKVSEERYKSFYDSLQKIIQAVFTADGGLRQFKEFFTNRHLLKFIALYPDRSDEIIRLPETEPYFFRLIQEGGPLYTNRNKIIETIFGSSNPILRMQQIATIFTKWTPYWKQLFLFTNTRIGDQLAAATSNYPITEILGIPLSKLIERHNIEKQKEPNKVTRLESIIADKEVLNKLIAGEIQSIPFSAINGIYKRVIFRDYLKRTIEVSRSEIAKQKADLRNRKRALTNLSLQPGNYIHGSAIEHIGSVLLSGNLPREALGEGAETDAYPFHVDFTRLQEEFIKTKGSLERILTESLSGAYGLTGRFGVDGQIFYVYDRSQADWEKGKEYGPAGEEGWHALILGGVPSTEISAIVLRNPSVTLEMTKRSILDNGFYIPVYNLQGELLFTPEEYDRAVEDMNLKIPVEVWDFSLKTGEQLGSNPGGEFTVPTKKGPVRYYVKFARAENTDHLWNEQLADNIYRFLGMPVPQTKVVKVEGSYGHASEILAEAIDGPRDDLKKGFIIDALLANWDIVANPSNTKNIRGVTYRIDNGGTLLFRAQGERKTNFSPVVEELKTMRRGYPGLTLDDINEQLEILKEKFPDEAIDKLVDGVRLNAKDRNFLKDILRKRRDYILNYNYTQLFQ